MTKFIISTLHAAAICALAAPLRELSTDRPDTTESPHTVDAGHVQWEMELAAWERNGSQRTLALGELNLKYGLSQATDLQVVLPLFTHERGGSEGFGDMEIRVKQNLWGNDDGPTSLAIMPFIKLPTASEALGNGQVEGGLILPYGFAAPGDWECVTMLEVDAHANEFRHGYHATYVTSLTTFHDLTPQTGLFMELVSVLSAERGSPWQAYFNTGLVCALTPQWQLDGGLRLGLTAAAADCTPFLGLSAKF